MRAIYPTQKDIKNENTLDAVLEAIKYSSSIYDFHYDVINMSALDDANARNETSVESIDRFDNLTEIFRYHGALKIRRTISDALATQRSMIV